MISLTLSKRRRATDKTGSDAGPAENAEASTILGADEQPVDTDTGQGAAIVESTESGSAHDDSSDSEHCMAAETTATRRGFSWRAALVYGVLPGLAMLLAVGSGFLKWKDTTADEISSARVESVHAAGEATIKMLSYQPDSVEKDLGSARDKMTGSFRDSYTRLIHDVVIPGAKQKRISATATVPAAASVSASPRHAVVLAFVNQTIIVGDDPPSSTASSVRVALDKVGDRWLISDFTPV